MSDIVLSLIPVGAALVGGIIGFAGAIVASRRTTKTAIEVARVSRLRERQYEVFATVYGQVNRIFALAHGHLLDADSNEAIVEANIELLEAIAKLQMQLITEDLWLPDDIREAIQEFLNAVRDQRKKFNDKSGRPGWVIQIDDPEYQQRTEACRLTLI